MSTNNYISVPYVFTDVVNDPLRTPTKRLTVHPTTDAFKLEYDLNTVLPKTFTINDSGMNWTNGALTFNTPLEKIGALATGLPAVVEPPNTSTLEINHTLLANDTTNPTTYISVDGSVPSITITDGVNTNVIGATATTPNLSSVLVAGNSAGSTDIDMNSNDIINCASVSSTTGSNLTISTDQNLILTADNVDLSSTGRLIVPSLASTNYMDYNTGKISVINNSVGGTANPLLVLQNNNNTAGSVAIETYKNKVNGAVNDTIANWSMYAKDYTGTKTEFARINSTITNSSAGSGNDGAINMWCSVNGAVQNVFTFNGADNENNSYRPLDLNGNDLKTSSGNMLIQTTASTGTGDITISPKGTLTLNSTTAPIQATNTIQMTTDKQILLFDSSPNVVATTLGNGEVKVDDLTGLSRTQMRPTDYYIIDTNTGDNTSYSINGFAKSDNSIQCNSNNGFVMNYGSTVNKTTLDLTKLEMYNTGSGGLLADTILLQNTGGGNPVINLYSYDVNTGNSAQMGASNSGVGITQTNSLSQSKSLSMNNTLAGSGLIQYTNGVDTSPLTISSNSSLGLSTSNDLILDGANIVSGSASGNSGNHLRLLINGTYYKIALLND